MLVPAEMLHERPHAARMKSGDKSISEADLFKKWATEGPLEDKDLTPEYLDKLPTLLIKAGVTQEKVDNTINPLKENYFFGPIDRRVKAAEAICDISVICALSEAYTDLLRITRMLTPKEAKEKRYNIIHETIHDEDGKNPKSKMHNASRKRGTIIKGLAESIKGLVKGLAITNNFNSKTNF